MSERTVRHRSDGPKTYFGPVRSGRGDEHTVDGETAAYLVDQTGYFEYVDEPNDGDDADLESLTYDDLYDRATEAGVEGRSSMDKTELIAALEEV